MANPNLYVVEKVCPICGEKTRVAKTKSRLMAVSSDCDFCTHYKDFNPYLYAIWVCEHCSYAADEKSFITSMPVTHKELLKKFVASHPVKFEFHEERDVPEAVAAFRLALFFEEMLKKPLGHQAGLHLELAWIYRIAGDKENEDQAMLKAATLYEQSVMTEHYPIGNLTDSTAQYLTGAIYYLLKDYDKATTFLGRLMADQNLRTTNAKMFDKVRDLWQDVRTEKEAADKAAGKTDESAKAPAKAPAKK